MPAYCAEAIAQNPRREIKRSNFCICSNLPNFLQSLLLPKPSGFGSIFFFFIWRIERHIIHVAAEQDVLLGFSNGYLKIFCTAQIPLHLVAVSSSKKRTHCMRSDA